MPEDEFLINEVDGDDAVSLTDLGRDLADFLSEDDGTRCDIRWDEETGVHRCVNCGVPFLSVPEVKDLIYESAETALDALSNEFGDDEAFDGGLAEETGGFVVIDLGDDLSF